MKKKKKHYSCCTQRISTDITIQIITHKKYIQSKFTPALVPQGKIFKKNAGDHITTLNHDLKGHQVLRSPHRVRCSIALFHPQIGLGKDSTETLLFQ